MSKLTISCASMYNGGAERVLSVLSYAFAEHYDEVEYVTWVKYPVMFEMHPKVKFYCIEEAVGSKSKKKQMIWFRRHIKETSPDIVLSLLAPFNMLTVTALAFTGRKIIVCERSDARHLKGGLKVRMIRNFLYRFSVGILSQTESNVKSLPAFLQKKCSVIFNPMNMDPSYIGKALKTPKDNVIVAVGRLIKVKNHEMLVRVFKRLLETYPDYKLIIYGLGENEDNLRAYIRSFDLSSRVLLPGNFPDIWDRICSARVYVHSSDYEGMPNALLEAMCLGLPCVSTKVNGAVDVIRDGENGLLVDVRDEDAFFTAIVRLLEDNVYSNRLGCEATLLYKQLNFDKIAAQWLSYIDDKIAE